MSKAWRVLQEISTSGFILRTMGLLGNFKQGRLTCGQALGWTPTCRKLTFLRLRERERSRAGKRQRDVTATDPAGGDGVG